MTKASAAQPPNIVLGQKVGAILSSRAPAAQKYSLAILELHKGVIAASRLNKEFNGFIVQLIILYRDANYINDAIISGRQGAETGLVEQALQYFVTDIVVEFDSDLIRLPMAKRQIEDIMPFAHFYAGLFSLARGRQDEALDRFIRADKFEGLGFTGKDLAEAIAAGTAANQLENVLNPIKVGINLAVGVPVTIRQPLSRSKVAPRPASDTPSPAPAAPKGPTDQDIENSKRLTGEGEQFAEKKDYIHSLRCLFSALNYDPDNASAQKALKHVLGFFDRGFTPNSFTPKDAPYKELEQIKSLLEVKPDFVPGLILAAWDAFALNDSRQTMGYVQAALRQAGEGKEKQYALFVAGFISYRQNDNAASNQYLTQIDPKSDIFSRAVYIIAVNYEKLKQGEEGIKFTQKHGQALGDVREKYFCALFLSLIGGPDNLALAERLIGEAIKLYEGREPDNRAPNSYRSLRDKIGAADLVARQVVAKEREAREAAARKLQEEAAVAAEEKKAAEEAARKAAEEAAAKKAEEENQQAKTEAARTKAEAIGERAEAEAAETDLKKQLEAMRQTLEKKQAELDQREQEIETKRQEMVKLLDAEFNKLLAWQEKLKALQAELDSKEPGAARQVVEIDPSKGERVRAQLFVMLSKAIITNDWGKVIAELESRLARERRVNLEQLLERIKIIASGQQPAQVSQNEDSSGLMKQMEEANAALEAIKKERTALKKQLQELERQLQEARSANETLRTKLAELVGGGASGKPKTFLEAWKWLSGKTSADLATIDPALESLFQAEEGRGRGAALTPAMIIERRRQLICALIDAHLNKGEKISSWTLVGMDQPFTSWVANKRVAPDRFDSIRKWVEAILGIMQGEI